MGRAAVFARKVAALPYRFGEPAVRQSALCLPAENIRPVCAGDIYALGRHRLMCGDATSKDDVATLFAAQNPTLVITSPPYAKQRNYDSPIACWDSLMLQALDGHALCKSVQILVNLGVVHTKGEWLPYWQNWISEMRAREWKHFGTYVWDKLSGYPGAFPGRMTPSFEFVFHINKKRGTINKSVPCYGGRTSLNRSGVRGKDGIRQQSKASTCASHKAPDSVIRLGAVKFGEATGHPAQMPLSLARFLLAAFKADSSVCYDPFSGSATTLLACEQESVVGLAMEISPAYVQLAINRWNKFYPHQSAKLVS